MYRPHLDRLFLGTAGSNCRGFQYSNGIMVTSVLWFTFVLLAWQRNARSKCPGAPGAVVDGNK